MAASNNTILRVLDGQQCGLDSKYGEGYLTKEENSIIPTYLFLWLSFSIASLRKHPATIAGYRYDVQKSYN